MNKKPFFSIIIPTYNPKQYLSVLLNSIVQNKCLDKIEVIISDDCSTEPFEDELETYKDNVNIRIIKNEKHAGFPRDGRQHGVECANGEWFCFIDQDDYFINNTFDKIEKFIKENKAENYIMSDFYEENTVNNERKIRDRTKGWTHGKFYQKSFWDKYKLSYDEIRYCEDINLSAKIECITMTEKIKVFEFDEPTYVWHRRADSLADQEYFIHSMPDYIRGTLGVIIDYLERFTEDEDIFCQLNVKFMATILHVYFYFQSALLYDRKKILIEAVNAMTPLYERFKDVTKFTTSDVLRYFGGELLPLYQQTRNEDYDQIPFIEQVAFKDWMMAYFD